MEFGILGPVEVRVDGRPLAVTASKPRTLLAALLVHANKVVTATRLIDLLWGEDPPASAKATLQSYVLQLRRLLPSPAGSQDGGGSCSPDPLATCSASSQNAWTWTASRAW